MQSAVDVDECFAVTRELTRVALAESLGMRESPGDLTLAIDLRRVVRTRDERDILCPALTRLAGFEHLHEFRRRRNPFEVVDSLVVGRELEIRAGTEAKDRIGSRKTVLRQQHNRRRQE